MVATLYTGPEAISHSFTRVEAGKWVHANWQFQYLDLLGRAAVLKFKGAEVALFFKRQIAEVEPLPSDPIPEGVIEDPADIWMRIDLLGMSAKQVTSKVGKDKRDLEQQLVLANQEIAAKQKLLDLQETEIFNLKKLSEKPDTFENASEVRKKGKKSRSTKGK